MVAITHGMHWPVAARGIWAMVAPIECRCTYVNACLDRSVNRIGGKLYRIRPLRPASWSQVARVV